MRIGNCTTPLRDCRFAFPVIQKNSNSRFHKRACTPPIIALLFARRSPSGVMISTFAHSNIVVLRMIALADNRKLCYSGNQDDDGEGREQGDRRDGPEVLRNLGSREGFIFRCFAVSC